MVTFHRDSCRHCLEAQKRHSSEQLYLPHPQAPTPHFRFGEKPWSFSIFIEQFWIHQKWSLARVLQQPEGHRKAQLGICITHLLSIHPFTSISDLWLKHTHYWSEPPWHQDVLLDVFLDVPRARKEQHSLGCEEVPGAQDCVGLEECCCPLCCVSPQHQAGVGAGQEPARAAGLTQGPPTTLHCGLGRGDWNNLTLFIVSISWETASSRTTEVQPTYSKQDYDLFLILYMNNVSSSNVVVSKPEIKSLYKQRLSALPLHVRQGSCLGNQALAGSEGKTGYHVSPKFRLVN